MKNFDRGLSLTKYFDLIIKLLEQTYECIDSERVYTVYAPFSLQWESRRQAANSDRRLTQIS